MPNRIIKESVNESRGLSNCSFFAQDLYKRLIVYADDYGRFNADPEIMLARLYPRELHDVSIDDLIDALCELVGVEKIGFYTSATRNDIFGAFPNWSEHQRVRDSKKKNPDPTDTNINDWYYRRFIPLEIKISILERDEFKCSICGKQIAEGIDAKKFIKMCTGAYHIDHIVPCNQGGRATMENLRLTCPKCNLSRKKTFNFSELLELAKTFSNSPQVAANSCEFRHNPIQSNQNQNTNQNQNPLIGYDEAHAIQAEQDRVFDAAEDAGFKVSNSVRANLLKLYAEHGLDKLLKAFESCVKHGAPNLAYLEACLKDQPRKKKGETYSQRDYTEVQDDLIAKQNARIAARLRGEGA